MAHALKPLLHFLYDHSFRMNYSSFNFVFHNSCHLLEIHSRMLRMLSSKRSSLPFFLSFFIKRKEKRNVSKCLQRKMDHSLYRQSSKQMGRLALLRPVNNSRPFVSDNIRDLLQVRDTRRYARVSTSVTGPDKFPCYH